MKRKIGLFGMMSVLAFAAVMFFGATLSPVFAADKPIVWTFASSSGAAANIWEFNPYPRFQELVEKATGGRLILDTKVNLFSFSGTLIGVIKGGADIGFQRLPIVSGTFPLWGFASLPFFFETVYEYEAALNDPEMIKIMDKSYAKAGLVKLFEAASNGSTAFFGGKPIATLEDFKGLKVRTSGLLPTFTMKALGANPLTISASEIAQALKRGTVDVISTSPAYGMGTGMTDISKEISYWPTWSSYGGAVVVNMKSWKALPPDLQEIMKDIGRKMQAEIFYGTFCEQLVAKKGIEIVGLNITIPEKSEVDKARKRAKGAIKEWLKVAGPDGQKVLDIVAKYASGAKLMLD
jgi:TRAP-type C4-dicarboxylate transport system substrate-binding protein